MASYLPKKQKLSRGARGGDKFRTHFEEAHTKLRAIIDNIEDTGEESTMLALQSYEDTGVPPTLVYEMLRKIRGDLLEVDRELFKANEASNGERKNQSKPVSAPHATSG